MTPTQNVEEPIKLIGSVTSSLVPQTGRRDCCLLTEAATTPTSETFASHCWNRTIWAVPHLRVARPLWSESGGRGPASATSAAASSPPRTRAPRRNRGHPRPGRGMSSFALAGPQCPMEQKRLKDTLGLTLERVSGVPPRGWRCGSLRLIARRWPVLRNRGGRPAARGSRRPRAMIARGRAGAPRRTRATAQARRASGQAHP